MHKAFNWKRSRISKLEVEAVSQSCIPQVQIGLSIVLYTSSLLLVESFDFCLSNHYLAWLVVLVVHRSGPVCRHLVCVGMKTLKVPRIVFCSFV
jgi:hypothetical protein